VSPELTSEQSEEPGREIATIRRRAAVAAPPREEEESFAAFWNLWQRGHGDDRERVRKAFADAVAEHGADAILASAQRWAAAREPKYLMEPIKWLAGGWQSKPAPKHGNGGSYRRTKKISPVMEALRAGGFNVDGADE
jgi:hypothetical protein